MIAEAPGASEVAQGRGLVGRAGKLLWRMGSGTLGFGREDFSCTNAIKCQPPNNDFDLAGGRAIKACRPALMHEIEKAQPSIILAIGDKALKALEIPGKISLLQGHAMKWHGYELLPMFHPSYYLHSKEPRVYDAIWDCLERVTGHRKTQRKDVPYEWWSDSGGRIHLLSGTSIVLDVETHVNGELRLIGFVPQRRSSFVAAEGPVQQVPFNGPLSTHDFTPVSCIIGHHVRSDYRKLREVGGISESWPGVLIDTLGIAQLNNENRENFELKSWAVDYGYGTYWREIHKHWNHREGNRKVPQDPPLEALRAYNAIDVALTRDLYHSERKKLDEDPQLARYHDNFFVHALKLCAELEINGIYISPEIKKAAPKLVRRIRYRHRKMEAKVRELGLEPPDKTWKGNYQRELIHEKLGLKAIKLTKTKLPSVDRDSLIELAKQDQTGIIQRYVELSSLGKQEEILQQLLDVAGGYAHPSFNLGGRGSKTMVEDTQGGRGSPVTGRLSANSPNSQQMPKWIRVYFTSRYTGGEILAADAKQIEIRVAYCYSGDPAFLVPDVHTQTQEVMNTMGIRKVLKSGRSVKRVFSRDEGKTGNFAVIYGAEVGRLMEAFGLTEDEAIQLRAGLREKYAIHFEWYEDLVRQVKRDGQVRSLTGRIRRLPLARGGKGQGHALKQATNFPIQNMASDMNILCALHLGARGPGWKMWNLVHDEIDIDCASHMVAKRLATRIKQYWQRDLARDVKHAFGYDLPCEFQVEVSTGSNWKDLTEL